MKTLPTTKEFAIAVCNLHGIDYKKHCVSGVQLHTQNDSLVEISVRFAVPYGLLAQIDAEMAKK